MSRYQGKHIVDLFERATPENLTLGLAWYAEANATARDVQALSGHGFRKPWTLAQSACVISALSPSNRWERNVDDAKALAKWFADGQAGEAPAVCTYGANRKKAIEIATQNVCRVRQNAYARLGSGPKTQAFARLIERPTLRHVVVIDRHAWRAFRGETPTQVSLNSADYREAEYAFFKATDALADKGSIAEHTTPAQVQAVCWLQYKGENAV